MDNCINLKPFSRQMLQDVSDALFNSLELFDQENNERQFESISRFRSLLELEISARRDEKKCLSCEG